MDDNTPILTKVNDNILLGNKAIALNDPVVQKQLGQMMQQNIIQNVYKPPKTDFIIKNPNEKSEELLEKVVKMLEENEKEINLLKELASKIISFNRFFIMFSESKSLEGCFFLYASNSLA